MSGSPVPTPPLAPLQRVMLRDSLAEEDAGHHVEQLEVQFSPGNWLARVPAAWQETVAGTEALRIAFVIDGGKPSGIEFVDPRNLAIEETRPDSWNAWLAADRRRPLLAAHEVPWRATYWPSAGKFIWTLHHALLDGRSITRILQGFLARVAGDPAEALTLSRWNPPTDDMIARARGIFRDYPEPFPDDSGFPEEEMEAAAVRFPGKDFRRKLESMAARVDVTVATILTWAWGRALMEISGTDSVVVEQLRSGAPQHGTAGFVMHTLPIVIRRESGEAYETSLCDFRTMLLEVREIEAVSPADFIYGVFPDVDHPRSSVVMVERGTLQHLTEREIVESLELHESKGDTLTATAHILPDLRIEVEGPGRFDLLETWWLVLERLAGTGINRDK